MEITLLIDGEEKSFTQSFVSAKYYRKSLKLLKKLEESETDQEATLNEQYELIVDIFEKQFTADQLENGLDARKVDEVLWDIIRKDILGWKSYSKMKQDMEQAESSFLAEALENLGKAK